MRNFTINTWPTKDFRISTVKVDNETGQILRVRETNKKKLKSWWISKGFSFNGKLTAKAN